MVYGDSRFNSTDFFSLVTVCKASFWTYRKRRRYVFLIITRNVERKTNWTPNKYMVKLVGESIMEEQQEERENSYSKGFRGQELVLGLEGCN